MGWMSNARIPRVCQGIVVAIVCMMGHGRAQEPVQPPFGSSPDSVVAFLGKPHRIPASRATALRKSLDTFGYDQYYRAEQKGWVLYLEYRTDLSILSAFAERFGHTARAALRSPFLVPIGNSPNKGREHFNALIEAKRDLQGLLLVDNDAPELQARDELKEWKWQRCEIENYVCQPETLIAFAEQFGAAQWPGTLFEAASVEKAVGSMRKAIEDRVTPAALRDREDAWWFKMKASDDFLDIVFPDFFRGLGLRTEVRKADYHQLVAHVPEEMIAPEVHSVLDMIAAVAAKANPGEHDPEIGETDTGQSN
jgi:hypothetical protein